MRTRTYYFETSAAGIPLTVEATPFTIATKEVRYRVSIDGGAVHILAWDESRDQFVAIKETTDKLPQSYVAAISHELQAIEHKKAA